MNWCSTRRDNARDSVKHSTKQATGEQRKVNVANTQKMVAETGQNGMTVNRLDDTVEFRKAVEPIYAQYRKQIGDDLMDGALKSAK